MTDAEDVLKTKEALSGQAPGSDGAVFAALERVFEELFDRSAVRRGSSGEFLANAWRVLEEFGLPLAMVRENRDEAGLSVAEAADLLRLVGYYAAPVPLADAMLCAALLARAGLPFARGFATLAPPMKTAAHLDTEKGVWTISGVARRVPWARDAQAIVLAVEHRDATHLLSLPADSCRLAHGANLASEPRDDVYFDTKIDASGIARLDAMSLGEIHAAGAALRTIMIAGAANRVLDMSVEYACEHNQFGRPISAFQAVQQNLAVLAAQSAICRAAGDLAAHAVFNSDGVLSVALAKARIGEAAALVASLGHQIHGAMGFTGECDLHLYTKRIWAWREEYGNDAEWSRYVGKAALDEHAGVWALITRSTE